MIIGKIHPGSGLGDQLFSYITTRTIALDKGYEFGFVGKEFFKGKDFMQLDWGKPVDIIFQIEEPAKKLVIPGYEQTVFEINTAYYDPESQFIEDGAVIDGCSAQDERYWRDRLSEIREWLKVKKPPIIEKLGEDECIINFRGGEYATVPELFLPREYWEEAIQMKKSQGVKNFEVHTDDVELAKQFFPNFPIWRDIAINWMSVRYAKHLILANSAFGILPALLNENVKEVIAPKYWAGRNVGEWRRPQNYYSKFIYI